MDGLGSVMWLGGAPGVGKTTVARLLARRHGLRWYNADAHTWEHRDRAIAAGHPAAIRYEESPIPDRWSAPMEERLAMSLHHERGPMVQDDLLALPTSPLTLAEGTPITPKVVGSGQALWLIPTPELQRDRLDERDLLPGVRELYQRLGDEITAEVKRFGGQMLVVDESWSLGEVVTKVESHFADLLAHGPVATSQLERRQLLRYANRAFVDQYQTFFTRSWARALGATSDVVLSFSCECAQAGCEKQIDLAVSDFPQPPDDGSLPLLAPGHYAMRTVQVSAVDSARAQPPDHLGARTSQWSLYGREE
ncbi:hypothetical protein OHB41_51185 [Streptomyces sp. NBC_01571]|uniref:hypothetical protein n=1 Tax=Streptomyces sp. NBC_01571 TaxID=2975883 RepID=UPI0022514CD1|nr:hypothetical protein [Streptomyces sp. NBC_01571]MCX4581323.1 hypothetical protein [Streptomyces sp. NBC_01571]